MKRRNTITHFLIMLMLFMAVFSSGFNISKKNVMAADAATISVSSVSGEKGSEVTVTVTVTSSSDIMGTDIYLSYDSNVVEAVSGFDAGGNGLIRWIDTSTYKTINKTFTFKILEVGTSAISVGNGTKIAGSEGYMSVSSSAGSITGNAPVTYSTNNNLASLQISPGVLSPAFSPSTTTYTTSVDKDCAKLVISATTEDANASVSIWGDVLDPGQNTTTITVTAQDGSRKVYTIYTTREVAEETPTESLDNNDYKDVEIKISDVTYKIKSDFTNNPLPEGYNEADYDYNGNKIKVGNGANNKLTIVYLETEDKKGVSGFYIYDSVAKTFTRLIEMSQPGIKYVVLDITDKMEKPAGYTLMESNIDGNNIKVLMNDKRTYCLFYGTNSLGVTGWFRYCIADKTIQVYDGNADGISYVVTEEQKEEKESEISVFFGMSYKKLFYISGIAALVILIILIIVSVSLGSSVSRYRHAFDEAMDELDEDPDMTAREFAERVEEDTVDEDSQDALEYYEDDEDEDIDGDALSEFEDDEYDDDNYAEEELEDDESDEDEYDDDDDILDDDLDDDDDDDDLDYETDDEADLQAAATYEELELVDISDETSESKGKKRR